MSIARWNLKEAGCGEYINPWANLWSDEQKSHKRLFTRVRLPHKPKPNNYTESWMVNVADRWRGKKRVVPREVCVKCSKRSTTAQGNEAVLNTQKSAKVIVAER